MNRDDGGETFFRRWSRVKGEAREVAHAPPAAAPAVPPAPQAQAAEAPPDLPPIEKLTLDSDFSGFFHPKVGEDLRRRALKKLFSDPHFNVMDGLDVYIDDYSKTEPIPAAMLASLKQAQRILEWAADDKSAAGTPRHERASNESESAADEVPSKALEEAPLDSVPDRVTVDHDTRTVAADAPAPPPPPSRKT